MPKDTFGNLACEKQQHILDSAIGEFAKAPYQNVSINTLIKSMGISTGSFYQYFVDKKDLYFYVLSHYMDSILQETQQTGMKVNLMDPQKNRNGTKDFSVSRSLPMYVPILVDNYNLAPLSIKRDWGFDVMIGHKYMDIYDYSFFENPKISEEFYNHQRLIMGMVMAIPLVVSQFADRRIDQEQYLALYDVCIRLIKGGLLSSKEHLKEEGETPS